MPDFHSNPQGSRPDHAARNNGPDNLALERFKIRELAEGWPCYRCQVPHDHPHFLRVSPRKLAKAWNRDHFEWENFRSIFHPGAFVYTTWTGRTALEDFIKLSQDGMDEGSHIMHRVHGTTVDIAGARAIAKMKATITQRFVIDGCEVDAEADCRFCMFFEKRADHWGACFVRHFYEKDKLIPVDPRKVPALDDAVLQSLPEGYRFLSYCQMQTIPGFKPLPMPGYRGPEHDRLYWQAKQWLDGENIHV